MLNNNDTINELWGEPEKASAPVQPVLIQTNLLDKKFLQKYRLRNSKKHLLVFAAFLCLIVFAVQASSLIAAGLGAKKALITNASAGLNALQQAKDFLANKDYSGAESQFNFAQQHFSQAQQDLNDLGALINTVIKSTKKGNAADNLVVAGRAISDAGINLNNFRLLSSEIKVSAQGFESPDGFYGTANAAKKYLLQSSKDLAIAKEALQNIDPKVLPLEFQEQLVHQLANMEVAANLSSQGYNLFDLLQRFIGENTKTILFLFENNAELRPSGGFIGTYGFFKLQNGKIISQKISSVYDLDGQVKDLYAPPGPFYDLTDKWGLRDSNWFADFRNSAKKASAFYEVTGGETPDAVIALTPDIFVDLLKITGPVQMPKYSITLNADNFRSLVQENTKESFDGGLSSPKQLLADFAPLFLQNLATIPKGSNLDLFSALLAGLQQKNILFYDRKPDVEKGFEEYNWAGEVLPTSFDYLQIINSNLGGKKTDFDVTQNARLQSSVNANGDIINTLTYTRTQNIDLAQPDKNITFSRFYVPDGSILLGTSGFTSKPFYKSDGSAYPFDTEAGKKFKIDPDLAQIDSTTTIDPDSGTIAAKESGKTYFANWIETLPGQTVTVVLQYKLPIKIQNKYSLLLQKQPGSLPINFSYSINLPQAVSWYSPDNLEFVENKLNYSTTLNSDKFIGVILKDPNATK